MSVGEAPQLLQARAALPNDALAVDQVCFEEQGNREDNLRRVERVKDLRTAVARLSRTMVRRITCSLMYRLLCK